MCERKKSKSDIVSFINGSYADYLGINVFTQNYNIVKYIIENISIKCKLFIGGQVVKSIYHEILKWNIKNELNIIIGEGEYIVPEIVLEKCKQKPELIQENKNVYRVNKKSIYFPDDISNIF